MSEPDDGAPRQEQGPESPRRTSMSSLPPGQPRWRLPGPAGQQPPAPAPSSRRSRVVVIVLWVLAAGGVVALLVLPTARTSPAPQSISYSSFLAKVTADGVKSVQINQASGVITGKLKGGADFTAQGSPGGMPAADVSLLDAHKVARNYESTASSPWTSMLGWLIPLGLIVVFWIWMMRRVQGQSAGLASWSRTQAKVQVTERPSTTLDDVAGYDGVKQEVREVVDFLKDPAPFGSIGARIPKGMLLVGPPGTGKTLLARAIAGEAGVPFVTISGSEFMEMFVGVGAARVRDLFAKARAQKPAIIFVDEIDAIGRKRGTGLGGGHDEREQTLNQLLSEMDGFEEAEGIVVLAATNRPDILDPALLRAGRFDRQVVVPLPTLDERRAILDVHCRGKRIGLDVTLDVAARGTPGMSGADLKNMVNEAALIAVRRGSGQIEQADMEAARDRVLMGLPRTSLVLGPEEKRIVATHEAGHALLAELLPHADPVHKVTILPIGMALGVTQQLPAEDRQLQQLPYLEDALAVRLGGRAAEEVVFGTPSTGAADDLTSATDLAGRMVREWGMSDAVGTMAWGSRGPVFLGEELIHTRDYSDKTARLIDEEVGRILGEQAARARLVLTEHRHALDALASALVADESLEGARIHAIVEDAEHATRRGAVVRRVGA